MVLLKSFRFKNMKLNWLVAPTTEITSCDILRLKAWIAKVNDTCKNRIHVFDTGQSYVLLWSWQDSCLCWVLLTCQVMSGKFDNSEKEYEDFISLIYIQYRHKIRSHCLFFTFFSSPYLDIHAVWFAETNWQTLSHDFLQRGAVWTGDDTEALTSYVTNYVIVPSILFSRKAVEAFDTLVIAQVNCDVNAAP